MLLITFYLLSQHINNFLLQLTAHIKKWWIRAVWCRRVAIWSNWRSYVRVVSHPIESLPNMPEGHHWIPQPAKGHMLCHFGWNLFKITPVGGTHANAFVTYLCLLASCAWRCLYCSGGWSPAFLSCWKHLEGYRQVACQEASTKAHMEHFSIYPLEDLKGRDVPQVCLHLFLTDSPTYMWPSR